MYSARCEEIRLVSQLELARDSFRQGWATHQGVLGFEETLVGISWLAIHPGNVGDVFVLLAQLDARRGGIKRRLHQGVDHTSRNTYDEYCRDQKAMPRRSAPVAQRGFADARSRHGVAATGPVADRTNFLVRCPGIGDYWRHKCSCWQESRGC